MFRFTVQWKEAQLNRWYRKGLATFDNLKPEMDKIGSFAIDEARKRLADRRSQVSIGRLAKSLVKRAFKRAVVISSVLRYALVQQQGGTIVPTRGKALAIPLRLADKRAHIWPRMVANRPGVTLFTIKFGGKVLLMYRRARTGKGGETIEQYPRWLLVRRVKIRGNPYLVKSRGLMDYIRQVIGDRWRRERRRAG